MPRLRSQTGFTRILPPELVERCLESLPFEEVHTIKQVSKEVRSAARRSLTRGRWRPVKYVLENAIVTNALERPSSAAEIATFRAAWAADPRQVLLEFVLLWHNNTESLGGWHQSQTWTSSEFYPSVARFLALVEPSIDGLGRFTMALERVEHHLRARGDGRFQEEMPITLLELWTERLGESALITRGPQDLPRMNLDELLNPESLVGSGLESWAEPSDMVTFIQWLGDWGGDQNQNFIDTARALSRNWKDRRKAGAFVAATESKIQEWASYESDGSESSGDY